MAKKVELKCNPITAEELLELLFRSIPDYFDYENFLKEFIESLSQKYLETSLDKGYDKEQQDWHKNIANALDQAVLAFNKEYP